MQNSVSTVISLVMAIVLILIVPMITLTDRNDNVVQENVKKIVEDFVIDVKSTGVITTTKYQTLESRLSTTGNTYDIEIELQILDENPGKKTNQVNYTKIGENVYYAEYTTQVLEKLQELDGKIDLKEGDYITVRVKNENDTVAQTLKRSFLAVMNTEQYAITTNSSGMISVNSSSQDTTTP